MNTLKTLPTFDRWLSGIKEPVVRGLIVARLKRLELGLMGDVEAVGEGVSELRIHMGSGWRIYFTIRNGKVIVLLAGGTKQTQKSDIKKAKILAAALK